MAIETVNAYSGPYTGNGSTTAFPFTFTVLGTDEIAVQLTATDGTVSTASPSAYSVSLTSAAPSAGTVTFTTPPAAGVKVVAYLNPSMKQETTFEDGSAWEAGPVEDAYDLAALRDQALRRDIDRGLRGPVGESPALLPSAALRKGKVLAFHETSGDPIPGPAIDVLGSVAAALGEIATVNDNLGLMGTIADMADDIGAVAGVAGDISTIVENLPTIEAVVDAAASVPAMVQNAQDAQAGALAAESAALGQVILAQTYADESAGYRDETQVLLAAVIAGVAGSNVYATKAALTAALSGLAANAYARVIQDESQGNRQTLYQKQSGVAVLIWRDPAGQYWYVDPRSGSDSNPGTPASPLATFEKAVSLSVYGDTIALVSGARIKFCDNLDNSVANGTYIVPEGVNVIGLGTKPEFNAFDKLTGSWTLATGTSYSKNFTSKFGDAAGGGGPGRVYPSAIYQTDSGQDWRVIEWHYVNEYADLAMAKAYIDAHLNTGLIYDTTGAGNFATGWKRGVTHQVYVNVGADPSAYNWLVKQRQIPQFTYNHRLENISFFGGIGHDGLICRGSYMRDVEVAYPGFHGCEITGTSTDNFVMREGPVPSAGYALHHFGDSTYWYKQWKATHRGTKVYNWPGSVWGMHGTNSNDGGGGPGAVMNTLIHEDGWFENVAFIGGIGSAEFRRCVFYGYTTLNDSGNAVYTDCALLQGPYRDYRNAGTGTVVALQSPPTGYKSTFNNCQIVAQSACRMAGGAVHFNRCRIVAIGNFSFLANFFPNTHDGVVVDSTVIQQFGGAPERAIIPVAGTLGAGAPYTFSNSHMAGYYEGRGLTGLTVDEHTIFGGDGGLTPSDDPRNPVAVSAWSTWRSLGERLLNSGGYFGRSLLFGTTRGPYQVSYGGGFAPLTPGNNTWYQPFATMLGSMTPRGIVGTTNATNSTLVYVYGLAGKLYKNSGNSNSNPFTAVATGVTNNFVGHLIDGAIIWLLGDDGSITKLDTSTDTVTQPVAAGAVVSYKLRGGVVMTSGSKLLVYGGSDDGTAGGAIYSTDNGVTWAAATGSIPKTVRSATKVNGVLVLGSCDGTGNGNLHTSTDVNVAFTSRNIRGLASWTIQSMAAETTQNQLVMALRGSAGQMNWATGPLRGAIGTIDASNSDPSTWKVKVKNLPFTPGYVAYNPQEFVGGSGVTASLICVGLTGQVLAFTESADADWTVGGLPGVTGYSLASYSDGRNTLFAPQSFRPRDDNGYFNA